MNSLFSMSVRVLVMYLMVFATMLFAGTGTANVSNPRISIPEMRESPVIDGLINEREWQDAVGNYGFINQVAPIRLADRNGQFWVGRKGEMLYLAIRTELPPNDGILTRVKALSKQDIREVFFDDSIELVLDPKRDRVAGDRTFYHIIFNANGALYDMSIDPDNKSNPVCTSWRLSDWTMKNTCHDGWWDVELSIPFSSLDIKPSDVSSEWGIRIARNWKRPFMQSQWGNGIAYDVQNTMPIVVCEDNAPVVHVLSLFDESRKDESDIKVKIVNPYDKKIDVAVSIQDSWYMDQHQVLKTTVSLPPESEKTFQLSAPDGGPEGDHRTIINITDPASKKVYYFRDFKWNMHRPKDAWQVGKNEKKKIDFKFKYYPYYNKIRLFVNTRGLKNTKISKGKIAIYQLKGDQPQKLLYTSKVLFDDGVTEDVQDIPGLADGKYRLILTLVGENAPKSPLIQDFARKHFEWEHNKLGLSDKVIPPFIPMEADGNIVKCVLRSFRHGDAGFWNKVVSVNTDILAEPIKLDVQFANGNEEVKGKGWKILSEKETEVVGTAAFEAGPLNGNIEAQYDYDGMMKCTLKIKPCETEVRGLTLRIPVVDRVARFMHACGDGLRHNYSGQIPTGDGKIWDSSKGNKIAIVGTFYPYIWVGDGECGLCWFADTDRDWVLDDETPTIDLVRKEGTLWLNVHFITKPGIIKREHKIVFGLQVTPTKPMPEGWRRWTQRKRIPGGRPVDLFGSSYYWGSPVGFDGMPYPLEKDFSYFEELKRMRETGKVDNQTHEFIKNWMTKVAKYFPEESVEYKRLSRHVKGSLCRAAETTWKQGWRVLPYTNARGIAFMDEEFPVFQDEWLNYAFFNREWSPTETRWYDATPSESWTDCVVWYYKKMLICFDGVYWDDLFLAGRYDPVVGDAWKDEDDNVHPGLGIFAMREMIKRTAVMFAEESKGMSSNRVPLITMAHISNTMIVPVLSFANCTFDWEWKFGFEDFQDRFTWGATVAETIGRQIGAWPTILLGYHSPRDENERKCLDRVFRSRLAVCLVNELTPSDHNPKSDIELYARLFKFGYGLPECKVYNYWKDGNPVVVNSATVEGKTLVISKPGAAIVAVTDYGDGGMCRVKLDLKELGLIDDVKATNFETGEAVKKVGPGEFELEIPKHDLRILLVQ